jgi:predicted nuclease of predicted toxin-antitoxin system
MRSFRPRSRPFLRSEFGVDAQHLLQLGLHETKDEGIFALAREARALVITKDADFVACSSGRAPRQGPCG